ncbi:hypothetical protein SKAU_G00295340 [Synaphobranchus kaupii]|uniref:Pyrin domain-containing protein n=1 Tax=Synaphobranchus kaupii TaxID=118154 RepID=A0A9Q1IMS6_SYNKA|nr:hypothetical protein SKAU_G00295340 [Synaphobranchus kaupii]
MGGVRDLLISTLDDMLGADLERFTYWLSNDLPEGFQPIGQGKLENKTVVGIVHLMVETYREQDVVKVALHALRKAHQNQLAQTLEKGYERILAVPPPPAGQGQTGGPSMAAPGAAPHVSIVNERGTVHAPVISHTTVTGDFNLNLGAGFPKST